jgi:hypothetical protein
VERLEEKRSLGKPKFRSEDNTKLNKASKPNQRITNPPLQSVHRGPLLKSTVRDIVHYFHLVPSLIARVTKTALLHIQDAAEKPDGF